MTKRTLHPGVGGARYDCDNGTVRIVPPVGLWTVTVTPHRALGSTIASTARSFHEAETAAESIVSCGVGNFSGYPLELPSDAMASLAKLALDVFADRTHPLGEVDASAIVEAIADVGRELRVEGFHISELKRATLHAAEQRALKARHERGERVVGLTGLPIADEGEGLGGLPF